ncbi:hypothetical protein [Desulfotalea psychrophila]|uniref:Uncharacterized protein n=1 Tax=Desulfotalea psychrophila (strain LSv54 / DSM 12343) TaxID=177439 RepID=Q6AMV2_DESPS|nr:hypothetical protein [Desulfotalea psychrophila]CAG36322.1 conserved hypothetical protein, probably cold-shock inducible [Desulfotalea psychrophila LSv54]
MAIQLENIKLMASQRLTDHDDGGGHMSGAEIVDGNVNNLYPDISRMDRVYGRVSLRKSFAFIDTNDTSVYSGAHAVVSVPAEDPNVSVCLFETGNPTDQRAAARDFIESYVTLGPRMSAWLWGDQPAGSRTIVLFASVKADLPDVGSVLSLFNNKDKSDEQQQYMRITNVKAEIRSFTIMVGDKEVTFERKIITLGIGNPLAHTFIGVEIHNNDAESTNVYTTMVSDAAKYYGVMLPKAPFAKGDISLPVKSIFTHLVPSAQGESPMVDLSPGEAGPVFGSGTGFSLSLPSQHFASGVQINVGRAIKPGTLTISRPSAVPALLEDNGDGIIMAGSQQWGTIDYGLGTVTFAGVSNHRASATLACVIGVAVPMLPNSAMVKVELASRGYNWTMILEPPPLPGTLKVDYRAQGKWFRLTDKGKGELVPETAGAGTGQINYTTGSVSLTCGALPDVGSAILYLWGNPIECIDIAGSTTVEIPELKHTLKKKPVKPGSLNLDWNTGIDPTDGATLIAKITDDGNGNLVGDGAGWIRYSTGELGWRATKLPADGENYEITYKQYPIREGSVSPTGSGLVSLTLPDGDIEPGSVAFAVPVTLGSFIHVYRVVDDGNGHLSAPGFSKKQSVSHATWPGSCSIGGFSGTINYLTGAVTLDLTTISGSETWKEPWYKKWTYTNSYFDLQYLLRYKDPQTVPVSWTGSSSLVTYSYRLTAASSSAGTETLPVPNYIIQLLPAAGYAIQPGSVAFRWQGALYIDRKGKLYRNPSTVTGVGALAGTIDYSTGSCACTVSGNGSPEVVIESLVACIGKQQSLSISFRTPGAPLRPGSINLVGSAVDGSPISLIADFDGRIGGAGGEGLVNYEQGIVTINFGEQVADSPAFAGQAWYDPADVKEGKVFKPMGAMAETINYGCVVYSYIPLDAELIGLDPVRLPTDGRVPIVRRGDVVVVHNAATETLTTSIAAGSSVTLAREPDSIDLYDSATVSLRVESTKYELVGAELTFAEGFDPNAYTLPIVVNNRIEDMALVSDADITGRVTLANGLSHAYPQENTFVSSALIFGDLQARLHGLFDQKTWTNVWSDSLIGDGCIASYNEINFPAVVTNAGAVAERWALIFDSSEHFKIVGENYGVVGDGYITKDCNPVNPATNKPYFFFDYRGFGQGWVAGNVLRFTTEGASPPIWAVRTTLQGPATEPNDQFTIQIRGDAE